ncbi:MAG TPA: imidazolonepropionase [Kofleriaceae bacterium]|nr:imidazolonepropionase [Kofleriaceae bacterium]
MSFVLTHARVMTCEGDALGVIDDGAIVVEGDRIAWIGADVPARFAALPTIDLGGRLLTPGLVDCHAHPLFAGDRANEFAMRARGATYQEIAAAGGGITATLGPTRAASIDELVALTRARTARALASGTTTMEAKSGYDLTLDGEVKLLEAARRASGPVTLVPTLLCHLVPPEARADRDAYVARFANELVPRVAKLGLARSVDVYCDDGAFTLSETRTVLHAAKHAGLDVRAHVGQFADLGGAGLLAELGARSADHVEQISRDQIDALARAGVVAVMLPGACVQLRMAPPPIAALRDAGVPLAVATDLNPGTSYCETLPIAMWLATTHYAMTVEETWLGVTRIAARALGLEGELGVLRAGARADLALWQTREPAEIPYHYGANLCAAVWCGGTLAHGST